jgi:hypothetical protein
VQPGMHEEWAARWRRGRWVTVALVCALGALSLIGAQAAAASTFGEEGEGAGQFLRSEAIAVDNSSELSLDSSIGDVYVADRGNNRVDKFSGDGEFLLAWGWGVADGKAEFETCGPAVSPTSVCHAGLNGSGAGQFEDASGVAVNGDSASLADGDVYVEDAGNHRVEKFTADGEFLLAWGEGVADGKEEAQTCGPEAAPATITCQAGVPPAVEGTGEGPGEFERMARDAIAVDSEGTVYVGDVARVQEFSEKGAFERQVTLAGLGFVEALAVSKAGDIFLMSGDGVREYKPCSTSCTGEEALPPRDPSAEGEESGIALGATGELFVDTHGRLSEFEATGEGQLASFPTAAPERGLAFGDGVGESYVLTPGEVQILPPPPPGPLVESEEAVAQPAGTATLTATFDPEGQTENASEESHFFFEYGKTASYEASTPAEPSTGGNFESRTVPAQQLKGLEPSREYHFRVVVSSAEGKTTDGPDETFTTLPAASVDTESASEVSATGARLGAQINPLGSQTEYHFEYGRTTAYEEGSVPVPDAGIGSGVNLVTVGVQLEGLSPATLYHYRVVAQNTLGEVLGRDHTFTTQGAPAAGLIDGRAWEMVSPPDKHGASLEMSTAEAGLFQAAEDGDGISYFAEAPITSDPSGARSFAYSQLLSKRGPEGWLEAEDITTPEESVEGLVSGGGLTEYKMFSSDLSSALVEPQGATPLCLPHPAKECPERTPYLRNAATREFQPLVTPENVLKGTKYGGKEQEPRPEQPGVGGAGFEGGVEFVSAAPDLSHVVLSSSLALTPGFEAGFGSGLSSLYMSTPGKPASEQLQLLSILPNGKPAAEEGQESNLGNSNRGVRNAISSDGQRAVFESGVNGDERHLYLRDLSLGRTLQLDVVQSGVVSPGGAFPVFVDATPDDSRVFFLDPQRLTGDSTAEEKKPDLYMCEITVAAGNLTCALKDLSVPLNAGEHADVVGPDLGTSESGTYVYLVATGVLAPGATEGSPNLYVHDTVSGTTRLVATLSPEDQPDWLQLGEEENQFKGITSRVSANGRYVAFMSQQSLTGYDNEDISSQAPGERLDEEVFLYHAPEPERLGSEAGTITCVSCDPTGARPHGVLDPPDAGEEELALLVDRPAVWKGKWLAGSLPSWPQISTLSALYQPRNLTSEGRLFFDSADALVPQDVNGKEDVYEYEPAATGSCTLSAGCVGLISSGTSSEESAFIDASGMGPGGSEGEDVFFMTSAKLAPQDTDNALDVYDAHVCSAVAPCPSPVADVPPACTTAESCRAAPAPAPDVFGKSASATFTGPGNSTSSPPPPAPKPRSLTRAQKLAKSLRTCRKKHGGARTSCEKAARRKYGPVKKAKKSSTDLRASR